MINISKRYKYSDCQKIKRTKPVDPGELWNSYLGAQGQLGRGRGLWIITHAHVGRGVTFSRNLAQNLLRGESKFVNFLPINCKISPISFRGNEIFRFLGIVKCFPLNVFPHYPSPVSTVHLNIHSVNLKRMYKIYSFCLKTFNFPIMSIFLP